MRFRMGFAVLGAVFCAGLVFAQAPEGAPPPDGKRPARPEDGLRRADANKDGKISFDELKAVRPEANPERFKAMDTNGDGFIGPEDRPAGDRGKGAGAREADPDARRELMEKLMSADANQDGKTSYAEVSAAKPGYAKADFDRMDRDKDGFITTADAPRPPQTGERPKQPGTAGARGGREARMTPEQREKLRERMQNADADKDGYVSREEARTGLPNVTDERFKAMDRNGDGKLGPDDGPAGAPRAN